MKEIVFSLCVIAAAVVVFVLTLFFPPDLAVEGGVGPRFFPQAIAILLAVLPLVLLVGALRLPKPRTADEADAGSTRRVAVAFLIIVGYAVAIEYIGFPFGTLVFMVAMTSFYLSPLTRRRVLGFALPVAAAATAVSYAIFGIALRIPLPRGVFF